MSNKFADDIVLSSTTGSLTFKDPTTGADQLKIIFHATDPSGSVTAPAGSIVSGPSGLYVGNGGTSYTSVSPKTFAGAAFDSTPILGSDTTAQSFDQVVTIPANFLVAGCAIDIDATVGLDLAGPADQYKCIITVGGISIWLQPTITAPAGPTTGRIRMSTRVVFYSVGSPATWLSASGLSADYLRAVPLVAGANVPQVIEGIAFLGGNTTVPVDVGVEWEWQVGANAASEAALETLSVTVVNP